MRVTRREVLRAGSAGALAAGGLALGGLPEAAADTRAPAAPVRATQRDWERLAAALSPGADLYRPGDSAYPPLALPFNHRYAGVLPAGIVACATTGDVRTAIRWARAVGLPTVPRSGLGHNYAGYSTTHGLLLSMARMTSITGVEDSRAARPRDYGPIHVVHNAGTLPVGAGVTNGDLRPLLEQHGMFVPTGRCPSVGVAGLVLGGGIGFSDKMFGLTCDRLVATTVVLADGEVVRAAEDSHPDLFWACRGGAGNNFGVHTSFTFHFERNVGFYQLRWSLDSARPAMTALQRIADEQAGNERFHCRVGMGTSGRTREEISKNANVNAIGQHYGTPEELRDIVNPLLATGTAARKGPQPGVDPRGDTRSGLRVAQRHHPGGHVRHQVSDARLRRPSRRPAGERGGRASAGLAGQRQPGRCGLRHVRPRRADQRRPTPRHTATTCSSSPQRPPGRTSTHPLWRPPTSSGWTSSTTPSSGRIRPVTPIRTPPTRN